MDLLQSPGFNGNFSMDPRGRCMQPNTPACQCLLEMNSPGVPEFCFDSQRDFGQGPSIPRCPQRGQALAAAESSLSPTPCPGLQRDSCRQSFVIPLDPGGGVGSALAGRVGLRRERTSSAGGQGGPALPCVMGAGAILLCPESCRWNRTCRVHLPEALISVEKCACKAFSFISSLNVNQDCGLPKQKRARRMALFPRGGATR